MPATLGHITLHTEGPGLVRDIWSPLTEACRRFEQLKSVGTIWSQWILEDEEAMDSVIRGCGELRERGVFYFCEEPSCEECACQTSVV